MHISPERIAQIERRHDEVQASMARPDLPAEEFVRLSKEYAELEPVARAAHEVRRLRQEFAALDYMANGDDPETDPLMREWRWRRCRRCAGNCPTPSARWRCN
jgi:peptide chain release factor 1